MRSQLHALLEVTGSGTPPIRRYKRAILKVPRNNRKGAGEREIYLMILDKEPLALVFGVTSMDAGNTLSTSDFTATRYAASHSHPICE